MPSAGSSHDSLTKEMVAPVRAGLASAADMDSATPLKATIVGSYRKHFDRIWAVAEELRALGVEVIRPASSTVIDASGPVVRLQGDPDDAAAIRDAQLAAINASDFVYAVNTGSYLGDESVWDLGYANGRGKPTFLREPPLPGQEFARHSEGAASPVVAVEMLRARLGETV